MVVKCRNLTKINLFGTKMVTAEYLMEGLIKIFMPTWITSGTNATPKSHLFPILVSADHAQDEEHMHTEQVTISN